MNAATAIDHGAPIRFYAGTYTGKGSRGIYRVAMDRSSGKLSAPVLAAETENPSFLLFHPGGRVLFAVNELAEGAVSAFAVDPATGDLSLLNQQPSHGADPCYLSVDRDGRDLLVANYTSGTVAVLPLEPDGRLRPASTVRAHAGRGPVPDRQEGPHAHAISLDAAERFALACDLGADRIFVYRFGAEAGSLEPHEPAAELDPGSGPRHVAWHPAGKHVYAISELSSTVTAFRYDAEQGTLEKFQRVSALPEGETAATIAGEIAISPDGKFLYGSNRGHDSIAVFAIDAATGTLTPLGHVPAGGRTPRHFAITPSGQWLVVANQDSDAIIPFGLDDVTGFPRSTGLELAISKPVCVRFAPQ